MKITFLLPGYATHPVGGYRVVYRYADDLAGLGHDVRIVQARRYIGAGRQRVGPRYEPWRTVVRDLLPRRNLPTWYTFDNPVQVYSGRSAAVSELTGSDVVVATSVYTAAAAAAAARSGPAGAYLIQHYEQWCMPAAYVDATYRLGLRNIVIAPWLQAKVREAGSDAVLVPNAIDPREFFPGDPVAHRPVGVVSMIGEQAFKRADIVIAILNDIAAGGRHRAAAFGIGSRPTGLDPRVQYLQSPSRVDLAELYQRSHVYLCASDAEGWHLPPAEAMACGTAVVSTDIRGVSDYAGNAALYAPAGDADGLSDHLRRLLGDDMLCQRFASAGLARIAARTPISAADDVAQVFAEAHRDPDGRRVWA